MNMQMSYVLGLPTNRVFAAVTQADIDKIQAYEKPIEEIHKYQPDTKYFKSTAGNEAWDVYSYNRHAEMFGPGSAKETTT